MAHCTLRHLVAIQPVDWIHSLENYFFKGVKRSCMKRAIISNNSFHNCKNAGELKNVHCGHTDSTKINRPGDNIRMY